MDPLPVKTGRPYPRGMADSAATRAALENRVWRAMFDLLMRSAPSRTASLARHGLTPNDSRALASLDTREGRPMRTLADLWGCDPSYATSIVDRLEALGLAERQAAPADRRVKLVVLTRKGERTRSQLLDDFHRAPAEIAGLDRADLEALDAVLGKLRDAAR
jgi:DNA-binding MarR family transcriptional regulator